MGSGATTNTSPSAGKLKNHQMTHFCSRPGGVCELEDDLSCLTTQTEDNSNVQIKPKVAIVDHTVGS